MESNGNRLPAHLRGGRRDEAEDTETDSDGVVSWGWKSTKPVFGVSFEKPDGLKRSFRYMHLESNMVFQGDTITMRFSGVKTYEVVIMGLRLESLYYLLQDDKVRAVRESARGFDADDSEPLVQSIVISEVKFDLNE